MSQTHLCNVCVAIPWKMLFLRHEDRLRNHNGFEGIIHHQSLASLEESSECALCEAVLKKFESQSHYDQSLFKDRAITLSLWSWWDELSSKHAMFDASLRQGHISVHFYCGEDDSENENDLERLFASFELCISEESSLARHLPGRLIAASPESEQAITIASRWLKECEANHPGCQRQAQRPLPTRVLDIRLPDLEHIRLVEPPQGQLGRFYALSHCWGTSQTYTTTTESLPTRKKSIRILDLPRTFQDAISITRQLGADYLWIDSLCIVQDDADDWERESRLMGNVYSNASLIIAASRADADSQGFLTDRKPTNGISMSIVLDAVTAYKVYLAKDITPLTSIVDPVADEPLSSRGWVVQERHLAHRTLFYATDQMYWECQTSKAAEYGTIWTRSQANSLSLIIRSMHPTSTEGVFKRYSLWYEMLGFYSKCNLSKDTDRLPAIRGLATAVQQATGERYYFGIWLRGFIFGLLWRRYGFDALRKPNSCRAPSWSWASVEGPREFILTHIRHVSFLETMDPVATLSTTAEISTEPASQEAALHLQGPLFPILQFRCLYDISCFPTLPEGIGRLGKPFQFERFAYVRIGTFNDNDSVDVHIPCMLDFSPEEGPFHVLFLAQHSPMVFPDFKNYQCYFGLVVKRLEGQPLRYQRVGVVEGMMMYSSPYKTDQATLSEYLEAEAAYSNLENAELDIDLTPEVYLLTMDLGRFSNHEIVLQ